MMRALLMTLALLPLGTPAQNSGKPAMAPFVADDVTIRTAVALWFSDRAAAEAKYGHISTWDTGRVTDMGGLFDVDHNSGAKFFNEDIGAWDTSGVTKMDWMFYGASAFDQDISAWDTSGVTTMRGMFFYASAFNQDLGGWAVQSVWDMTYVFGYASAFDQDLGWCVDDDVFMMEAFDGTACWSTSCGVNWAAAVRCGGNGRATIDDDTIKTAVFRWFWTPAAAEAMYGHITTWETGGVTDMSELFSLTSFNEDISAWDTSGVTTMRGMFWLASSFNQDLSGWAIDKVTDMTYMFLSATAFDQDLGWCVDDDVDFDNSPFFLNSTIQDAFSGTMCASTLCGVKQVAGTGCAP